MTTRRVMAANTRSPDADEPWRFVCPECGGQVHSRESTQQPWECDRCRKVWAKDELHDKKTSGEVTPSV